MNAALKVSGIDHVVFHVKDLARARKFYVDFLGLEVEHERDWQCFLKCGNQGIALFEVDDGEFLYRLSSPSGQGFIVARSCDRHEDEKEYFDQDIWGMLPARV